MRQYNERNKKIVRIYHVKTWTMKLISTFFSYFSYLFSLLYTLTMIPTTITMLYVHVKYNHAQRRNFLWSVRLVFNFEYRKRVDYSLQRKSNFEGLVLFHALIVSERWLKSSRHYKEITAVVCWRYCWTIQPSINLSWRLLMEFDAYSGLGWHFF